ncbi:NACHT domain-containing protein [Saccharopolyspora sp. NPDC050389]|uniref:NACHT domain-containing protein n=1 Tax=Saccharopolyspora sp. NPDC050389 TaxID=3155516 RepID=UPI0033D22CAB
MHKNEVNGPVHGHVVQANCIQGGIHVHRSEPSEARRRLRDALREATVAVGSGSGVRLAPGVVLTHASLTGLEAESLGGGLALIRTEPDDQPYACATVGTPADDERVVVGSETGAPVLDWRTGGVCGVLDDAGDLVAVPAVPELAAARLNHDWLDRLSAEQLRAGGWQHVGPRLRRYLTTVGRADHEHAYSLVSRQAPPLSKIYLARQATRLADAAEPPELLERLQADRLLEHHPGVQVLGYPGMGKSSLVRRLAAESARQWLAEGDGEFVPVLIPAEALTRTATLPDALADGVVHGFSHQLDRSQLVELFGAEPLPGVRWLVLVDGLDEVLDPAARLDVLRKIGELREQPEYWVLITSRPLDRRGFLGRIDQTRYPTFSIEPFTDDELRDFAARVLRERQHPGPEAAAADFLARVHRTKLRTLAHVPLISTMLCLLYAENPNDELPDNQSQLYGRFVSWLKTKLSELDARTLMRNRVFKHGPTAERAVDELVENIEPLLQEIAFGRQKLGAEQRDLPLFEHALAWTGVERPAAMSPEEWADVLADVLRVSGLVIQPGSEFQFLHQTVEEYLAACHLVARSDPRTWSGRRLLAPQPRWPWSHLEVKTFLAARWAEEGIDLTRMLRKLLRWGRWRNNVGFLAELARHGVVLDRDLVDRAVRILCKVVANPKSASREWQDCLTWLADLDEDRAVTELEVLAGTAAEHRRYEAVRELASLDSERAIPSIRQFINDTAIKKTPRTALARHLRDLGVEQAHALFADVAADSDNGALRVEAAEILVSVLGQDLTVLSRLAGDRGLDDDAQLDAGEILLAHDVDRGLSALSGLVRSAVKPGVRRRAVRLIEGHDPGRAETELTALVESEKAPIARRFDAASLLVKEHGRDVELVLEIAESRKLDRELRLEAARMARGGNRKAVVALVLDIVDSCSATDSYRLEALEYLAGLDGAAAFPGLRDFVRTRGQTDPDRFRAAEIAAKSSGPAAADLYGELAKSSDVDSALRVQAARAALAKHDTTGAALLAGIAEDSEAQPEDRHEAALALFSHDGVKGVDALVVIGEDRSLPGALRMKALEKAHSERAGAVRKALAHLAEDTAVAEAIRLHAAQKVGDRKTSERLLAGLAAGAKSDETRFDAARALSRVNRNRGLAALRDLESDQRVSRSTREKATKAAERLDR